MELAITYCVQRAEHRADDCVDDLVLFDSATGERRRLVGGVAWQRPSWSADGRRVRFGQQRGAVLREVDVQTGTVEDVYDDDDPVDVAVLPGYDSNPRRSPAGRWIAYADVNYKFRVADAFRAYVVTLPFHYVAFEPFWSPCGTRLAAHLTAAEHSGTYVIDLRTGTWVRVSPPPTDDRGLVNYHVWGWTFDGTRLLTVRSQWHDPQTCDYELIDLVLLAADGSAVEPLTDDGRCHRAAIRPTGEAPPDNGEHELTFDWAHPLHDTGEGPPAGEALAAQIQIDAAGASLRVVLMVRTADGVEFRPVALTDTVADGFSRLDAFLREHDYRPGHAFTVVFPRYGSDDPYHEIELVRLAHLVSEQAVARHWAFDRELPSG